MRKPRQASLGLALAHRARQSPFPNFSTAIAILARVGSQPLSSPLSRGSTSYPYDPPRVFELQKWLRCPGFCREVAISSVISSITSCGDFAICPSTAMPVMLLKRRGCCKIALFAGARLGDDLVQRRDGHERAQGYAAGHLLGVDGHPGGARKTNFQAPLSPT